MLLAGAVTAILTGICGVIVCVRPVHIICNMTVGLFFTLSFLLLLLNGIVIVFVSNVGETAIDSFCFSANTATGPMGTVIKAIQDSITNVDNTIADYQNGQMCSDNCPCKPPVPNPWANMTSDDLKPFNRTSLVFRANATIETAA